MDQNQLEALIRDVIAEVLGSGAAAGQPAPAEDIRKAVAESVSRIQAETDEIPDDQLVDITSHEVRQRILIANPMDVEMMNRMRQMTNARIGAGRSGPRLNTVTMLTLRANHATARDSVFSEVDPALLEEMNLFSVQTRCTDKSIYLTRPDLGRRLNEESRAELDRRCKKHVQAQIYVSDGLSSKAVEANVRDILPAILNGLESFGISTGTPFFVKYGRVGVEDEISELLDAEVVCVLLGERPGLSTAESMSAYLAYRATIGMPESRRTVVSNIHRDGINSVEAGAYVAEIIRIMLEKKAAVRGCHA